MRRARAVAASIVLALVLMGAACSGSDGGGDDDASATTTAPPAPTTTTEVPVEAGEVIGTYAPTVGDCFDRRLVEQSLVDPGSEDEGLTPAILRLDCGLPHRYEVFAVLQVPEELAPLDENGIAAYPGDTALSAFARAQCTASFEPYVGTPYEVSELEIDFHLPSASEWDRDLQEIGCLLHELDGSKVVGSARGVAR